ncbi:alpha/beta hydrolase-fold protein [Amycolatopsis anabasis]|uniref:alpha/beta hydrolase-fold protein n=1 Tax=Amycolatopsis anabasis TaxID=1840409 RepID=UPI003CCD2048
MAGLPRRHRLLRDALQRWARLRRLGHHATGLRPRHDASACRVCARRQLGRGHDGSAHRHPGGSHAADPALHPGQRRLRGRRRTALGSAAQQRPRAARRVHRQGAHRCRGDGSPSGREEADAYLAELRDTHADAFLGFLTAELHLRIERDYGTATSGHGLFGYSYGGLFSLYTWLTGSTLFESIGAGSPGVAGEDSQIFAQLQEMGNRQHAAKLHVTLNERELLGDLAIYQNITKNTATVLHRLTSRGAAVTSAVLRETHVTGLQASFLSYLRACRAR